MLYYFINNQEERIPVMAIRENSTNIDIYCTSGNKKVIDIYCRVSTDDQEENTSLDEQEEVGKQYCRENGLIVGKVHREIFTGYQYREREKLGLMRKRYQEGTIQGVVVRTIDRLSRSQVHNAILMEEMEHYDVTLHCVKEKIDDTPMGKFVRMVLGFVAEMEREKILDRTLTGRFNSVKEGKISAVGAYKLLYGFQWHDTEKKDYIIVNPKQADIIKELAEPYANGESCESLIRYLTAKGVPSPGQEAIAAGRKPREGETGMWNRRTIIKILTDPRITGKGVTVFNTHHKGAKNMLEPVQIPDGTYPAIISEELYQRILQRARTNKEDASKNGKHPEEYLLRAGFIKCHCGESMLTAMDYNSYKAPTTGNIIKYDYHIYQCNNHGNNHKKSCVRRNSKKLDEMVWHEVEELANHVTLIEKAVRLATSDKRLYHDARNIDASLDTWKKKIANYQQDLEDPELRGDTRAGIRHLLNSANEMIEKLEVERAQVIGGMIDKEKEKEAYERILAWCRKVKEAREPLTYQQKRDFFRLLGLVVQLEEKNEKRGETAYQIKVKLPEIQALLPQNADKIQIAGTTCPDSLD